MRNQNKLHLSTITTCYAKLDLWQAVPPSQRSLLSEEPFAIDTMSPEEWLQWFLFQECLPYLKWR